MILRKLLAVLTLFMSMNLAAATISGNVYCDINDNGTIDTGEVCPSEGIWVKLHNLDTNKARSRRHSVLRAHIRLISKQQVISGSL